MSTDLSDLSWPVDAGRVLLRPLQDADAAAVHGYRRRQDVAQWLGGRAGDLATFTRWFLRPDRAARTLVVEHDGLVVGDLLLTVRDGWADVEMTPHAVGTDAELGWVDGYGYALLADEWHARAGGLSG